MCSKHDLLTLTWQLKLLKMDIESSEWPVLRAMFEGDWSVLPDQFAIELHYNIQSIGSTDYVQGTDIRKSVVRLPQSWPLCRMTEVAHLSTFRSIRCGAFLRHSSPGWLSGCLGGEELVQRLLQRVHVCEGTLPRVRGRIKKQAVSGKRTAEVRLHKKQAIKIGQWVMS